MRIKHIEGKSYIQVDDYNKTVQRAIAALDAIEPGDEEMMHYQADRIIRETLPIEVRHAYERVMERANWWAYA